MNKYTIYKNVAFIYEVEANSEEEARKIVLADTEEKNFTDVSDEVFLDIYQFE